MADLIGSITINGEVGPPFPQFHRITLDIYSDGTVRWRPPVG